MRFLIQSSTDGGVVWSTVDSAPTVEKAEAECVRFSLHDDVLASYRVIDNDASLVVFELRGGTEAA